MSEQKTSDKVFEHIKNNIINKTWKAGEKITSELQLVEELGVSRVTVREAIQRLVVMNVLTKRKGGGTFVNEVSPTDYMDELLPLLILGNIHYIQILEFRLALDTQAVKLFIDRADEIDLQNLKDNYENMKNSQDNAKEFFKYDIEFHKIICKGSKNPILYKITNMLFGIMEGHVRDEYHQLDAVTRLEEHKRILDNIIAKDTVLAEIYTQRHLERTIEDLKELEE